MQQLNMIKIVTLSLIALMTSIILTFTFDYSPDTTQAISLELGKNESVMAYDYSNDTGHYFIDLQVPTNENIVYIPLHLINADTLQQGQRFVIGYYSDGYEMDYFYPIK